MTWTILKPHADAARDPLRAFREEARAMLDRLGPNAKGAPRTKILAVGAELRDRDGLETLSLNDHSYLEECFARMEQLSIPIDPAFDLTIANYIYGDDQDFRLPTFKVDTQIILVCNVFNMDHPSWSFDTKPFTAWHDTAARCGAEAIVAIGGFAEICAYQFILGDPKREAFSILADQEDSLVRFPGSGRHKIRGEVNVLLRRERPAPAMPTEGRTKRPQAMAPTLPRTKQGLAVLTSLDQLKHVSVRG